MPTRSHQTVYRILFIVAFLTVIPLAGLLALEFSPTARIHWNKLTSSKKPLTILFIGNSHTFVHDVPKLLEQVSWSADFPVETTMLAVGGASLQDHLRAGEYKAHLNTPPDLVILQEQSTTPASNVSAFKKAYQQLHGIFASKGSKVMLYGVWPRDPKKDRTPIWGRSWSGTTEKSLGNNLWRGYLSTAGRSGTVPAIKAWEYYYEGGRTPSLHSPDGNHASPTGAYLAALCFYTRLSGDNDLSEVTDVPSGIDRTTLDRLHKAASLACRR